MVTIDHDIGRAVHVRDAVDGEADALIDADPEIEERNRHDERVDDGRRQQVEGTALSDEPRNALLETPLGQTDVAFEPDATGVKTLRQVVAIGLNRARRKRAA